MIADTPISDNVESGELDFAALLDQYDFEMPYRGQILEGIILDVKDDEILIDVGLKRDAIVPRKDLMMLDSKLRERITAGGKIMAYVLQPRDNDGELIVSINKAFELEDWENAREFSEKGETVEADVLDANKGGLLVRFGRLNGFVPQSHIVSLPRFASDDELQEAKKKIVGQKLALKFIEIDRKRNRLILSEREARIEAQQSRMNQLEEGMKVKGKVVSIVKFGAFVDLGGVDGLIHISKLDHQHVNHPGEILAIGDEVEVLIDGIDADKNRISLNRVALLPDPWSNIERDYNIGDLIEGKVTNVVDFGVFVQLPNNLQGLVHVSKMSMFGSTNPHDLLREGDEVLVRIISIESDRQRIGLSIDDVAVDEQEEWLHNRRAEAAAKNETAAPIYNMLDKVRAQQQATQAQALEEAAEAETAVDAEAETAVEAEVETVVEAVAEEAVNTEEA